jgi:hypothetical protein
VRRFLRWLWALDLLCTAGSSAVLPVAVHLHDQSVQAERDSFVAAHSNILSAVTGASAFYGNNHDSFKGIVAADANRCAYSCPASSFYFVASEPSTEPQVITVAVKASGQQIVMAAYVPRAATCVGVLGAAAGQVFQPNFGLGKVSYFQISASSPRACNAASVHPASLSPIPW